MCEYCDGTGKEINDDTDDNAIYISADHKIVAEIYTGIYGSYYVQGKINFCPMCGRKLIEE